MVLKCDKYTMRQLFIMASVWLQGMGCGIVLAYPTVLKERLSTNGTDFIITAEQSSWLASCVGISGIFGYIMFSTLLQVVGRKFVHITLINLYIVSWIIFYFAMNIVWLFVGRFFHGLIFGSTYINSIIISEYTSPQTRGYYITLLKTAMSMGSLICHSLSFWSWREPAVAGIVLAISALILNLFWPESPAHCAMKGRLKDCKKSFLWLNGSSTEKRKELIELISAQIMDRQIENRNNFCTILGALKEKDFQKALLITSLLTLAVDSSGRFFVIAYITQIMMEVVGTGSAVYYSILIDALAATAFLLSCFTLKCMKRRTILFVFGSVTALLMLAVTLVFFLKSKNIGSNIIWITPFLIISQNVIVNLTMIPVCYTLFGELFALHHRSSGCCLSGIVFMMLYSINLKITPMMLKDLGLGGTYGAYSVCLLLTLFILFFIVVETKNKTLQQIEDEMKGVRRNMDQLAQLTENLNDYINNTTININNSDEITTIH